MIRVTIEMWPGGDSTKRYPLGHINIANIGVNADQSRGDYIVKFFGRDGRELKRNVLINGWHRLTKPVFSLVLEALTQGGYKGAKS
jgi:hypothetical protein